MDTLSTQEYLLKQCSLYPLAQTEDLLKFLHQSVFGPGHFVTDPAAGLERLQAELATASFADGPDTEDLDGPFCRVHLRMLKRSGLSAEALFRAFSLSAASDGTVAQLEEKLSVLLALAGSGLLPFSYENCASAANAWRAEGFPARHHSAAFRAAYAPAYRVVRKDLVRLLPLLSAIDRALLSRPQVIVGIEGGSAAGKTTLAATLNKLYDCNLFHMDDFFLRPEQRTENRLAEPGENVDHERFLEEVLQPLCRGDAVSYRRYDCRTQTVLPAVEIPPKALNIVEGAYCMHPALAGHYTLSVFLQVSPDLQRKRIRIRNDPETAERFFSQWIPLETAYFSAYPPTQRCNLILETE